MYINSLKVHKARTKRKGLAKSENETRSKKPIYLPHNIKTKITPNKPKLR